jgi:F-type H+-transporting ATPase subunit a
LCRSPLLAMTLLPVSSSSKSHGWFRAWFGVCALLAVCVFSAHGAAAEPAAAAPVVLEQITSAPAPAQQAEAPESGLPTAAVPLYYGIGGHAPIKDSDGKVLEPAKFGPFALTNSMLLTWIVTIVLIAFAQYATRQIKQVPDGAQNFWEWLVESLRDFLEGILGRQLTKRTFWFFATLFIFILATNWFGLLPGVGTIGWGHFNAQGEMVHIDRPLLRGVNADLNMTFGMSMIFFACWIFWAIQSNGVGGALLHVFGPKGETSGFMKAFMIVIFGLVGILEVISILFRPVSLAFRLYGNIFAGENVLDAMSHKVIWLAPIIPIPFYFMELLVGIVQALVFMLLTAVFTLLICAHGEEPHAEHH